MKGNKIMKEKKIIVYIYILLSIYCAPSTICGRYYYFSDLEDLET